MTLARDSLLLAHKDLRIELRSQAAESEFGPEDNLEGAETMGEPSARITTELHAPFAGDVESPARWQTRRG